MNFYLERLINVPSPLLYLWYFCVEKNLKYMGNATCKVFSFSIVKVRHEMCKQTDRQGLVLETVACLKIIEDDFLKLHFFEFEKGES